jgi:predicted dehydrogenase
MIRICVVGLGKMGLSHLSIIRVHPAAQLVGVCDLSKYFLDVLKKASGVATFTDYEKMFAETKPDAVIVAVPSRFHAGVVKAALKHRVHVFCEKPFCLDWGESAKLASEADGAGLVNQIGYHYRFVAAFQEMQKLIELGSIGKISHVLAEAYGPVVLHSKGSTWRTKKEEGGGCLYDYAAHPVNLLNWFFGMPDQVGETVLGQLFSSQTDDEVYSTFRYRNGLSAQLSVNWSDESCRKMTVKVSAWGTLGKICADRQECQVYLRDAANAPAGYGKGWTVRYTTELTQPVWFYLRGEEYSAQLDYFMRCIESGERKNLNSFSSAAETDRVLSMMVEDARSAPQVPRKADVGVNVAARV